MAQVLDYTCPSCGGAITFDSTLQKMKCPYCESEFDVSQMQNGAGTAAQENSASNQPDDMAWNINPGGQWRPGETDGIAEYVCKTCGGTITGDYNLAATSCPYCGNPVVMTGNLSGTLRPDLIIPFKLDKNAAKAALKKHVSSRKLVPKIFKNDQHIDEIKGIYVPFWLFDADAHADIDYNATKVRAWSDSKYNYAETSFFKVYRSGGVTFTAVPVDGSSKMEDSLMESIEPFNLNEAVDFNTAYLAGYLADKYDVSADASIERANSRVKKSVESMFASTVKGYSTVSASSSSIKLNNAQARYALYPVWILNTTWKDKRYTFAMNGQTGKLVGEVPLDRGSYRKWFALLAPLLCASFYGIVFLLHNFLGLL
ncbi:MAG: hypothetical protein IKS19_02845 [Clostridia bacterium]|nr:hypothetical protein [Clostridia bacterium]